VLEKDTVLRLEVFDHDAVNITSVKEMTALKVGVRGWLCGGCCSVSLKSRNMPAFDFPGSTCHVTLLFAGTTHCLSGSTQAHVPHRLFSGRVCRC
jgi:hypothetical protein